MAILKSESFEGTPGAVITTANTSFGYVEGAPVFSSTSLHGSTAFQNGGTAPHGQIYLDSTITTGYLRAYLRLTATPPTFYFSQFLLNTAQNATLSVQSDRGLRMRSGSSTTLGETSSSFKLNLNEWYRIEWAVTSVSQQLRIYGGANLEGTTPSYDSGPISWAGTTFNRVAVGSTVNVPGAALLVDEVAVGDSWVGSVVPAPASTVFRFDGTVWVPVEITLIT